MIDIVAALVIALRHGVHTHALGVSWFVLILYVPLVCVSQATIFERLVARRAPPVSEATAAAAQSAASRR